MLFSANLGLLWTEHDLPTAIHAAARAGFDAVECHEPYAYAPDQVKAALEATGLPMLSLNTRRGAGFGTAALDDAEQAQQDVVEALAYAAALNTKRVHVLAGLAEGADARQSYLDTLRFACAQAEPHGITLLIEPLNRHDVPGYFLKTTDQALEIIAKLGVPNLKMIFDIYHVQAGEGDVTRRFAALQSLIGHVQMAAAPHRGRPDEGELDMVYILRALRDAGWSGPVGAEYKPGGATEDSLGWLPRFQAL